ncbi:MAG: phage tail assembly protein [Bryobacterales bacterium]|nr:phage tail assembly protein [Bryobacterales bacterium]
MTKYADLPRDEAGDIESLKVVIPVEFPLATPIEADGATVSSHSIREPVVADVEIAEKEKSALVRMLRMLSLVADASPNELRACRS